MFSSTFARLEACSAPVALLHDTTLLLRRSASGKVWHRTESRLFAEYSCSAAARLQRDPSAVERTFSYAEIAAADLRVCTSRSCRPRRFVDIYASRAAAMMEAVDRFDTAATDGRWADATVALSQLERQVTSTQHKQQAAMQQLRIWAEGQLLPRTSRLQDGLAAARGAVLRAVGARDVIFDRAAAAALGVHLAVAKAALATWQEEVELIHLPAQVSAATVESARAAAEVLDVHFVAQPVVELIDQWSRCADRGGESEVTETTFALLVSARSDQLVDSSDNPWAWQYMASVVFPTVEAGPAAATLVGPRIAERVWEHLLVRPGQDIWVVDADPDTFEAVARTALGLWDRSYPPVTVLSSASAAWAAATVIVGSTAT